MTLSVRAAIAGDESVLRALRLQALTDAPAEFASTYERELARTIADWRRWLSPGATFILETAEGPRGLVAGVPDPADPSVVQLMSMWVHPSMRRSGAADRLIQRVVEWAATNGATVVRLDVLTTNDRARRCYERNGFRLTGRETGRERDGLVDVTMELRAPFRRPGPNGDIAGRSEGGER